MAYSINADSMPMEPNTVTSRSNLPNQRCNQPGTRQSSWIIERRTRWGHTYVTPFQSHIRHALSGWVCVLTSEQSFSP